MKSGNKQIINVVTLDIDKCCEGRKQESDWDDMVLGEFQVSGEGTPSEAYTATVPT